MGKVILVASGKGGTGKTLFAANIGTLLALRNKKTVMIDMDLGLRNLDLYMGLENKVVYNVMDVLSGVCGIKKALIKDKRFDSLYLMAASPYKDNRDITPLHMQVLCEKLKAEFDYVIIDAPAGIGDGLEIAAAASDLAVIITEGEYASVRDADIVDSKLKDIGVKNVCCVINKVNAELMAMGAVPNITDITGRLHMKMIGFIQYDDNVYIATNRGVPIVFKPGTYIEKNFSNILDRIIEESEK